MTLCLKVKNQPAHKAVPLQLCCEHRGGLKPAIYEQKFSTERRSPRLAYSVKLNNDTSVEDYRTATGETF